jgi:hypothetical protein
MMLTAVLVDRHLIEARLEHRARFVPSRDETGDDRLDIVEIEGGVTMSIRLRGSRFGVVRYHHDDGELAATDGCGWYDTLWPWRRCVWSRCCGGGRHEADRPNCPARHPSRHLEPTPPPAPAAAKIHPPKLRGDLRHPPARR